MGNGIHHVCSVVINVHGLASRDRYPCTGGVLNQYRVGTSVIDDIDLLDLAPGPKD